MRNLFIFTIAILSFKVLANNTRTVEFEALQLTPKKTQVMAQGFVISKSNYSIRSPIDEYFESALDIGERVKAGDVVGKIRSLPLEIEIKRAQVTLRKLEVEKRKLTRKIELNQAIIQRGGASKEDLKDLEDALASMLFEIEINKLNIENLQVELDNRLLRSPVNGIISERHFAPSEYLKKHDLIIDIISNDKRYFEIMVSSKYFGKIKINDDVQLISKSSKAKIKSKVLKIIPQLEKSTQHFKLLVALQGASDFLTGEEVGTTIYIDNSYQYSVNKDALINENGDFYIYKVDNGRIEKISVGEGVYNGNQWYFKSNAGLAEGDKIVVNGNLKVHPGELVNAVPAKAIRNKL